MPNGRLVMNGIYDMKSDSFAYFAPGEEIYIDWTIPDVAVDAMELVSGWNMISMPVIPVSTTAEDVVGFSPGPPFGYDASTRTYFEV